MIRPSKYTSKSKSSLRTFTSVIICTRFKIFKDFKRFLKFYRFLGFEVCLNFVEMFEIFEIFWDLKKNLPSAKKCLAKIIENYWLPADTLHGNGRSSVNMNATEMWNIPKDGQCHWPSFGMLHISVAFILTELWPFLWRVSAGGQ